MNYFGLFFTFMVPGIVIGVMAAVAFYQEAKAQKLRRERLRLAATRSVVPRDRLYVHDLTRAA